MSDENNDNDWFEQIKNEWIKPILKIIGILFLVAIVIIIVGFGLIVGICTFGK